MLPEFLRQVPAESTIPVVVLAVRLGVAFGLGCMVAGIHRLTVGAKPVDDDRPLDATLVLLSVLIGLVTLVIGDNVARAFSLVGALAIVRCRTVVADTRDTTFVMFAVIAGMAAGTGHLLAPVICAPIVLLGAWLFRRREPPPHGRPGTLSFRLNAGRTIDTVAPAIARHLGDGTRLTGVTTAKGGAALDVTFAVYLPPPEQVFAVIEDLGKVDGIQSIELREA
jgi:hypothetical protein